MDLDFTEEQNLLRDTARKICEDYSSLAVTREVEGHPLGYSEDFWRALAESGLCGIRIDESHGGVGMGLLEAVIVYEEMGRVLAPSPHFASAVLAARLLALCSPGEQIIRWLATIADGSAIVVPAWEETGISGDINAIGTTISRDGGKLTLRGDKILVPFASTADAFLVTGKIDGRPAVALVSREELPAAPRKMENHAGQPLFALSLNDLSIDESQLVSEDVGEIWDRAMMEGLIALAGQASGGAQRILEITTEYAKQREQFGQPIGGFQAIAHYLADCATEVAGSRYLAYQAAWAADEGHPFDRLALLAKWQTTAVFRRATFTGVQVHGGIGYSLEADPQLFYRRAKHQQLMYWDPYYLEHRIAREIFR